MHTPFATDANVPAKHSVQLAEPGWLTMPTPHCVQLADAFPEKVPSGQIEQVMVVLQ